MKFAMIQDGNAVCPKCDFAYKLGRDAQPGDEIECGCGTSFTVPEIEQEKR